MGFNKFKLALMTGTILSVSLSGNVVPLYASGLSEVPSAVNENKTEDSSVENTDGIGNKESKEVVGNKEKQTKEERLEIKDKNVTILAKQDGLYVVDGGAERKLQDSEHKSLLANLGYSLADEIKTSYATLIEENLESDHLKLENWGEFLYFYADKPISSMPSGDYTLTFKDNNNTVTLQGDRPTRQWIENELMPSLKSIVVDVSTSFVIAVNKYMPQNTMYLSDLKFEDLTNTSNLSEDYKVHPFKGKLNGSDDAEISLSVHSIGQIYGVQLHRDFVSVVNNITNDTGIFITLDDTYNSCVSKVINLGVVANSDEHSILEPKALDYLSIEDFGIDISDNSVIKINSIDGNSFEKVGTLEDFGLATDTVAIKKLSDGVVAVPIMYKEYFQTSEKIFPNGFTVDLTPLVFSNSSDVKVDESLTENIERYVGVNGVVDVRFIPENKEFIILNGLGKTHYGRMCAWIWSGESDNYISDKDQIKYLEIAEKWYKDNGKKDELKMYMHQYNGYNSKVASGKELNPVVKVAIGGVILAILGGVGFLSYKLMAKKKKASESFKSSSKEFDDSSLAFGFDEDDDE